MIEGVLGADDVLDGWRRHERRVVVAPEAIVTEAARDAAERLGVAIVVGPVEQPTVPRANGPVEMRRVLYRRNPGWMAPPPPRGRTPQRLRRLAIVGAGGVGATTAHLAAAGGIAHEVVLIDIVPGLAESTALDLMHASGSTRSDARVRGGTGLDQLAGADVVVMTAGRPRGPGMSRADLVAVNDRVVRQVGEQVAAHAADAVVVMVTNPLDEMTVAIHEATGFPRERVLGMAGTLDSSRFRHHLAEAAGVRPADVSAITLGSHGAEMVPVTSSATIRGRPLRQVLDADAIGRAVARTVGAGGEVVALRRTGSATIAPAHAVVEVLDAIRGARADAVPVSVLLDGEYGISGSVVGVPAVLGLSGVLEVVELPLDQDERRQLAEAAAAVARRVQARAGA